jgi:hypothetical protein
VAPVALRLEIDPVPLIFIEAKEIFPDPDIAPVPPNRFNVGPATGREIVLAERVLALITPPTALEQSNEPVFRLMLNTSSSSLISFSMRRKLLFWVNRAREMFSFPVTSVIVII